MIEIAQHLLSDYANDEGKAFKEFAADAERAILDYPWPGNVRELENVIRNAIVLNDGDAIEASMLPLQEIPEQQVAAEAMPVAAMPAMAVAGGGAVSHAFVEPMPVPPPQMGSDIASLAGQIRPLAEVEKEAIQNAVALCGGDVAKKRRCCSVSVRPPSTANARLGAKASLFWLPGLGLHLQSRPGNLLRIC